jgi:hypothetical protein
MYSEEPRAAAITWRDRIRRVTRATAHRARQSL